MLACQIAANALIRKRSLSREGICGPERVLQRWRLHRLSRPPVCNQPSDRNFAGGSDLVVGTSIVRGHVDDDGERQFRSRHGQPATAGLSRGNYTGVDDRQHTALKPLLKLICQ